MNNFSLTQAGNITSFASLISLVARFAGFEIAQNEAVELLTGVALLVGIITSWIGRYRKKDLTPLGFRK